MGAKLDEIIKSVNKQAKDEIISKGLSTYDYERIPFTSPRMNFMTYGGLAEGKLIEFFGENHGGKTTTALDIVANFQEKYPDREILYVDAENSLDTVWATKIGVDVERMYILQPKAQSAEEIFEIMLNAVNSGEVGLWVLDSIGALMSQQEFDKTIEEKTYGGISMALTKFAKKVEQANHKYNCTGIGINQQRANMNSPYGGYITPGGEAWKFFCSTRIQFSMGKFFDAKGNDLTRGAENPAGNYVMASIIKNKTAPPSRRLGQYRIRYDMGIDYLADLVDVAILYNIIDKHGAWYSIVNPATGEILKESIQGITNVYALLEEDESLLEQLEEMVNDHSDTPTEED